MSIEDRNIRKGDRFVAKYKGTRYVVEATGPEALQVVEPEKQSMTYRTLSAAGKAIMGGIACNGWRFFTREGDEKPSRRERRASVAAAAGDSDRHIVRVIKRTPNQKGVEDGKVKWFCSDCMASFVAGTERPEACPKGHPADAVDDIAAA